MLKKSFYIFLWVSFYAHLQAFFEFSGSESCLEFVGEDSGLIIENEQSFEGGTIKFANDSIKDKITSINGKPIKFNNSILKKNNQKVLFSGEMHKDNSIKAANPTKIFLRGNRSINYEDIVVTEQICISNNKNSIGGRPVFAEKIILEDQNAELELALQNKLNNNIVLNGGKLKLGADLHLKDGVNIEGNGTIDINSYSLKFPAKVAASTGSISFINANDIQLTGYTTLSSTWSFTGEGATSTLNGFGNVLDISAGGGINVGPNHTLYMTGVNLMGLGASGGFITMDATSVIYVASSIIELAGSYILSAGKISIISPNCKIVVHNSEKMVITGSGVLEINKVLFQYESLGTAPIYPPPFLPYAGGNISLLGTGIIQSTNFDLFKGEVQMTIPAEAGQNYVTGGVNMTSQTIVHFVNENPATPKNMTLNLTGKTIKYDIATPGSVIGDENINLTMINGILDNLSDATLSLRGSGPTKAKFAFGDGLSVVLRKDKTISTNPFKCVGDVTVDGNNCTVTVPDANMITIENGKTLVLKNMTIKLDNPNGILCLDDSSTIVLQNVYLIIGTDGFNIPTGNFVFRDFVEIYTNNNNTMLSNINFTSNGSLVIEAKTNFKILPNINLIYSPTARDGESLSSQKNRILFTDASSSLSLSNCKIDARQIGIMFSTGNLIIDKLVDFSLSQAVGSELELATNLNLLVGTNSIIQVDGPVKYKLV